MTRSGPFALPGCVKISTAFFSVVPSPYQRDLFSALAQRPEIDLHVFYLEAESPDSPWPKRPLAPYERILSGFWFPIGSARVHLNWPLPHVAPFDVVVMNTLVSLTAQRLMRGPLRRKPWIFWGERLGRGGALHQRMSAPLHRAAAIASIGTFAQEDYRERFPEPRSYCIPYHCALDAFLAQPRRDRSDGTVVFLFCGQMIARKGVDVLLRAFAELPENARLLLVGREAELPQMLAALPEAVRKRIEYAGFQAPENLPQFFARADVFILPSRYDGWGVVVNQALAAGLPVLCSTMVGAGRDLVVDDENGRRFPPDDDVALRDAMLRFLEEPALVESWGAASREKARDYTPARGAERWVAALQEVCGR